MTDVVVSIQKLSKVFGRGNLTALKDISFDVERGEFISLIGPSGCGKSTLLRIVGDIIEPSTGAVTVNGKPARRARLDRDYGIVFQSPVLYDWRTVTRNISLPLEMLGWDRGRRAKRVKEMLQLVELEGFDGVPVVRRREHDGRVADLPGDGEPVLAGDLDVEEDDVRPQRARLL